MKITLNILIFLFSILGFSQSGVSSFEQDLYDRANFKINALDYLEIKDGLKSDSPEVVKYVTKIKQKATTEAMDLFQQIFDTLPNTKLLNKINLDIARMHLRWGNSKLAKEYFIKVMDNSQPITLGNDESENSSRNSICITLAEISIEDEDYSTAIKYLDESQKYKIRYYCGNSIIEHGERLKKLYSICQNGIKNNK